MQAGRLELDDEHQQQQRQSKGHTHVLFDSLSNAESEKLKDTLLNADTTRYHILCSYQLSCHFSMQ